MHCIYPRDQTKFLFPKHLDSLLFFFFIAQETKTRLSGLPGNYTSRRSKKKPFFFHTPMDSWLNTHYFSCGLSFQSSNQNILIGSYLASCRKKWRKKYRSYKRWQKPHQQKNSQSTQSQKVHHRIKFGPQPIPWGVCGNYPQQLGFISFWNLIDLIKPLAWPHISRGRR